jgi:hypothetical protein
LIPKKEKKTKKSKKTKNDGKVEIEKSAKKKKKGNECENFHSLAVRTEEEEVEHQ